ncbi:daple-like protein [Contarinia nasturtii]|uniref:daple-like protein n=1 Tax=Contarinia nasturtii TaxID=265458 RepID=UPI0012D37B19|nr:daple-like protein [Contarinia nasturtii]
MSTNATTTEIDEFLNGALITWLESCLPRPEHLNGYQSLFDASIFHAVWRNIDPEPQFYPQPLTDLDDTAIPIVRAKNFDNVIRNMRALYEEELGQTILVVPDCMTLGHTPESKAGLEQMKLLFTLLLGAAVQCPNKQFFIARIKELEVDTQHAIVDIIKSVTDSQTLVLNTDTVDSDRRYNLSVEHLIDLVVRIARERDKYHTDWITQVTPNPNDAKFSTLETSTNQTATINSDQSHFAVELADLKSKLRKLRQDLDEKTDAYLQTKEELEHKNSQYEKLRRETQEWYTESCRAAAYRDEVDVLRERADRADQLELEMQRIREKLSDADFFKSRVDELRQDNEMLSKTKEMLEDQLTQSRKRFEQSMTLESEIIKYKQKLNDMVLERDSDREKLQELLDENTTLQLAMKSLNKLSDVDRVKSKENDSLVGDNSLSEQLTNNAQTRAIKLELENRRLQQALDAMRETNFQETANKMLELEKEKKMLTLKLEQIQENCNRFTQQNQELEEMFKNALEENKKLQDAIDNRQQATERQMQDKELDRLKLDAVEKQVETLTKEKQRIQNLSVSIQRRADDLERFLETKKKELETILPKAEACDRFEIETLDLKEKISGLEKENANLMKDLNKFKATLETKEVQLDENCAQLLLQTNEIETLRKQLSTAQTECGKIQDLESKNNEYVTQLKMKVETLSTLQNDLITKNVLISKIQKDLEKLNINWPTNDEDMVDLSVENVLEKLMHSPENWKVLREIANRDGGGTSDDGSSACILCQRNVDVVATEREADLVNQTEEVLSSVSAEWKAQCDQLAAANVELQATNDTLNQELIKQKVDISTLGSQVTSLNTQHVALQLANSQLASEKDALVKQMETIEVQHKSLLADQKQMQTLHDQLSIEYESLSKEHKKLKESLRDVRHDNRNFHDQEQNFKQQINELQTKLLTMKKENEAYSNLRSEHSKLKDDFRSLFTTNDRVKNEYKSIQEQYKIIRTENAKLNLQNTELNGELSVRIDQAKALEIELTKEANRCEMLVQMNANLDIDRRSLMDHVSQLLTQYHELLGHSLDDKQHYHDEEKLFTDKVNNLHRQKEKLEEKIMEFYRKVDSNQKKKPFGSGVLRRVKKAGTDLMNKVPTKSNRRSWLDESRLTQSQFTLGFESGGNESDNSGEEPHSTASDTNLLKKETQITIQRKANDQNNDAVSNYQPLIRDDLLRTSRNTLTGRFESPDVTGSSLTLAAAGSRRTVYVVDDNSKLPDTTTQTSDSELIGSHASNNRNHSIISNNNSSISSNSNNNNHSTSHDQVPSTFVMYNRISNVMGDPKSNNQHSPNNSVVNDNASNGNGGKDKKKGDDHVWYEYGCV